MIERLPHSDNPERFLLEAGLLPDRWSAPAHTRFAAHRHDRVKRLFVLSGAISFGSLDLERGQGIRIPAGHEHHAEAGDDGVKCVEAFEPNFPPVPPTGTAEDLTDAGARLGKLGHHDEAVETLDRALELEPEFAPAWRVKGDVLISMGRPIEGAAAQHRAADLENPTISSTALEPAEPPPTGFRGAMLRAFRRIRLHRWTATVASGAFSLAISWLLFVFVVIPTPTAHTATLPTVMVQDDGPPEPTIFTIRYPRTPHRVTTLHVEYGDGGVDSTQIPPGRGMLEGVMAHHYSCETSAAVRPPERAFVGRAYVDNESVTGFSVRHPCPKGEPQPPDGGPATPAPS
ncbi:MAG: hypothetical protein ABR564_00870 [Candidatus Dormibacteria bacterium]